jgi:hypothetical protein
MIKNKVGLATVVLGAALAVLSPAVASAYDRDDYYRHDDHRGREWRERERHESEERRERERARERYRDRSYYNNGGYGYGNGYCSQPRGYYDRYGRWHAY